jgi:hypothetical protein
MLAAISSGSRVYEPSIRGKTSTLLKNFISTSLRPVETTLRAAHPDRSSCSSFRREKSALQPPVPDRTCSGRLNSG